MITVTAEIPKKVQEEIKYPVIARNPITGSVIWYVSKHAGTLLFTENNPQYCGNYRLTWADVEGLEILPVGSKITFRV